MFQTTQKRGVLFTLFLLLSINTCFSQWRCAANSQGGGNLKMINANIGYGIKFNTLVKTTNGGATWKSLQLSQSEAVLDFTISPTGIGYMVTEDGGIFKTIDQGTTWCKISTLSSQIIKLQFINDSVGYAINISGVFYKTIDGGMTWSYKTPFGNAASIQDMFFKDESRGFVIGGGKFRSTMDGGITWTEQNIAGNCMAVLASRVWILSNNSLIRSVNNGLNWDSTNIGSQSSTKIQFISASVGWRLTSLGFERTVDGGVTWSSGSGISPQKLVSFAFSSSMDGVATDQLGNYYVSNDGGATWTVTSIGASPSFAVNTYGVFAVNSNTAYMVNNNGECLRTTNGGLQWSLVRKFNATLLVSTYFTSGAKMGGIVGQSGLVNTTNDSGLTWTERAIGNTTFYDIVYANSTFYAVGSNGAIRKGTHFQTGWSSVTSGTTQVLRSVNFPSSQIGYIVGHGGVILKTSDGGSTWQSQNSGTTENLIQAAFKSDQEGMVVGTNGTALYTTNGGATWIAFPTNTSEHLLSVSNIYSNQWIIAGNNGNIYEKRGGSPIRFVQETASSNPLNAIDFFDNENGIIVGNGGLIYEYKSPCINTSPVLYHSPDQLIICANDSTKLFASGKGKIKWYASSGAIAELASGQTFQTPALLSNTSYFVEDSSCAISTRVRVDIVVESVRPIVTTQRSTNQLLCVNKQGGSRLIASANTGRVKWYDTAPFQYVPVVVSDTFFTPQMTPGIYQYAARAEKGYCKSEPLAFTFDVRFREPYPNTVRDTICSGQSTVINIGSPTDFIYWYSDTLAQVNIGFGNSFPTPILFKDTLFFASVQPSGGCPYYNAVIAVNVNPIPDVTVTKGQDSSLQVAQVDANYQWLDCVTQSAIPNATAQVFNPSVSGNFAVKVDLDGCVDTSDCVSIMVISTGLNELNSDKITVYPNPTTEVLQLNMDVANMGEVNLTLKDATGKVVHQQIVTTTLTSIDLSQLSTGIYFLSIDGAAIKAERKIQLTR